MVNYPLKHDGQITICTGSSRKTKVWKSKKILWSTLVQKLSQTKRTPETQAQYFKFKKENQDAIKDVGGFVGGELENGKRTALTTINRQILTLDADFASQDFIEKVDLLFDHALCIYSTHKHTKDNPRYRLVIPLNRAVSPDEYQAISRKVAEKFGIDFFDDTTYQPHRLMYWASSSIDGEFFFKVKDEEWLNADEILAEYDDWQDVSTWPKSQKAKDIVQHELKKAEDPLTKTGLIGAFCKAYTISEAIEKFLPDVYEECDDNRYTFKAGSSTGGAIVYDDKWLYSFHATDPCSLQLCNAFDLVRIHKFGDLDADNNTKKILPSYDRMLEFCSQDEKTKIFNIQTDFEDLGDDKSWLGKLAVNPKTGKILTTRPNIRVILENDPRLKNSFGHDLFTRKTVIFRPLPWHKKDENAKYWLDKDDTALRYFLEAEYQINNKLFVDDEITNVAYLHSFHSVRQYLQSLVWDGKPRVETFFVDYLGAVNCDFVRQVTRKTLVAAVTRIFEPGKKFDEMIILEGKQGKNKSYLLSKLGKNWFSDSLDTMQGKEASELLRGYWIIEISELDAMNRSEITSVKKFMSRQVDSYRPPYGQRVQDFPRECIFFGTTNEKIMLKDKTGNRRFWPISIGLNQPTKSPWDDNIEDEIDQVWAEATTYYQNDEDTWIGKEMEEIAREIQQQYTEVNPMVGVIEDYLARELPENWYNLSVEMRVEFINNQNFDIDMGKSFVRGKICPLEIWCELLDGDVKRLKSYEMKEILSVLNSLPDWEPSEKILPFGMGYGKQRGYVKKKEVALDDVL